MKTKILHIAVCASIAVGLFFLIEALAKPKQDYTELFTGYDDDISFIVQGYQLHWDGFSPEDFGLSYIYRYESPFGGFVKTDLNQDGTDELLLGDQFANGDYRIYDIFTFDKTTGEMIHLFCGGERNWCTFNGGGVIIETGSNSAADSFTRYHRIKNLKLKKLGRNQPITKDLFIPTLDKFINYAKPRVCGGPEMKVVVGNDGKIGRYVGENETSYQAETQDFYWISKDDARLEIMKACDGQGILTLRMPGEKPFFCRPETNSDVVGMMIHEQGYVPEVYRCLGYLGGWFQTEVDGKTGFIQENLVSWDAINTF